MVAGVGGGGELDRVAVVGCAAGAAAASAGRRLVGAADGAVP